MCPSCKESWARSECADPWAYCLGCRRGHRFFVLPEPPLWGDAKRAVLMEFPELSDRSPGEIAAFWLTDPGAREVLNEQLAILLRVFLEDRHVEADAVVAHCPLCGGLLEEVESREIAVVRLRCPAGHEWDWRGSRLFGGVAGQPATLHAEPSDRVVRSHIDAWLSENPRLAVDRPPSIRAVLRVARDRSRENR